MKEKILVNFDLEDVRFVRIIGALILLGSGLMILNSVYNLISIISILIGPVGQSVVLEFGSLTIYGEVGGLETSMKLGLLLVPLAGIAFWSILFVLGILFYSSENFRVSLIEVISGFKENKSIEETSEDKKETKRNSKGRKRYVKARGFVCPDCGRSFDSERGLHIHQSKSH